MKFATKLALGAATGAVVYGALRVAKGLREGTSIGEQAASAQREAQAAVGALVGQVTALADDLLTKVDGLLSAKAEAKADEGPAA